MLHFTTGAPLSRALTLALPSLCCCFLLCLRLRLQARALLEPGSQEGSSEIVSDEDTQPSRQLVRLGRAIWRPRVVLLLLDGDLDRDRVRIRVGSGQGRASTRPYLLNRWLAQPAAERAVWRKVREEAERGHDDQPLRVGQDRAPAATCRALDLRITLRKVWVLGCHHVCTTRHDERRRGDH